MARSRSGTPPGEEPPTGWVSAETAREPPTEAAAAAAIPSATSASTGSKDEADMSEDRAIPPAPEAAPVATTEEAGSLVETAPGALQAGADMLSRMIYTGCYALAYGVVYSAVFVAQSLPQQNPFMHGFRDGGKAAVDELGTPTAVAAVEAG
jgi:hypothetical protein